MTSLAQYTPEERARALCYFFGWQGGTIHQLAAATGCDVATLLHKQERGGPDRYGLSAVRTCSADWRRDKLAPQHQGDWPFWCDVIRGFWLTGPLDGLNDRHETNHAH